MLQNQSGQADSMMSSEDSLKFELETYENL